LVSKYFVLLNIFLLKKVFYLRDPILHESARVSGLDARFGMEG
jgi:hypothetical protein